MWVGFWAVEVPPSPKVQLQAVGPSADWSVKLTSSGYWPLVGEPTKSAVGAGGDVTVM